MDAETIITWGSKEKQAHVFSSDPTIKKRIQLIKGSRMVGDGYEADFDVKDIVSFIKKK